MKTLFVLLFGAPTALERIILLLLLLTVIFVILLSISKSQKAKNVCPKCYTKYDYGTMFCKNCGCNLASSKNLVCPVCNKSFPCGTKYCDNDGTKLLESTTVMIPRCSKCGTVYPNTTKFCPNDGAPIILVEEQSDQILPSDANFAGTYSKAPLWYRFAAYLLDGLIVTGLAIPSIIFYFKGMYELPGYRKDVLDYGVIGIHNTPLYCFRLAAFLYIIPLIYTFIKDGLGAGQSWGKKAMGLMVIHLPDKQPCSIGKSFLRNFISLLIAIIPFVGWLIEPIMVLATNDGRKLADKAADTQVIKIKR